MHMSKIIVPAPGNSDSFQLPPSALILPDQWKKFCLRPEHNPEEENHAYNSVFPLPALWFRSDCSVQMHL